MSTLKLYSPLFAGLLLSIIACDEKEKVVEPGVRETASLLKNPTAPAPSAPLAVNDELFDFTALAHNGQKLKLSSFLDKPVFIYFCPQDQAAACTQVAQTLRDSWLDLNAELSMAFGVSMEDTVVHRDFSSTHKLPFLLIADTAGSVHRVMGIKAGTVMGYLVGTDRKITRVFRPLVPQTLAADILQSIRTPPAASPPLATGSVSPAPSN